MKSMYEQFETDGDREKKGVWLDYGDFRVRIARAGGSNKDYQKALERVTRSHRQSIKAQTMDSDFAEDLVRRVYAQTVILDWETKVEDKLKKGIQQKGSKELLKVNTANVLSTIRALPALFEDIQEQSREITLFRSALKDELLGNS